MFADIVMILTIMTGNCVSLVAPFRVSYDVEGVEIGIRIGRQEKENCLLRVKQAVFVLEVFYGIF